MSETTPQKTAPRGGSSYSTTPRPDGLGTPNPKARRGKGGGKGRDKPPPLTVAGAAAAVTAGSKLKNMRNRKSTGSKKSPPRVLPPPPPPPPLPPAPPSSFQSPARPGGSWAAGPPSTGQKESGPCPQSGSISTAGPAAATVGEGPADPLKNHSENEAEAWNHLANAIASENQGLEDESEAETFQRLQVGRLLAACLL